MDYKNGPELLAFIGGVTRGPWHNIKPFGTRYVFPVYVADASIKEYEEPEWADAEFIALSREALPYWIERATQAERAVERLTDLLVNEELCPQECENTAIRPDTTEDERVQICRECWRKWAEANVVTPFNHRLYCANHCAIDNVWYEK
jgi:hypothetical protein